MLKLKYNLSKFLKDPIGFIKRVLFKTIIAPFKYGLRENYNASKYWHDRFAKYKLSLKGAGDEGLSETDNQKMYEKAKRSFLTICKKNNIDFKHSNVLEIGCGTGFYTNLLQDLKVKNYVGLDITNILFKKLKNQSPKFIFIQKDITKDKLNQKHDIIIMIDVIEHIVNEDKLKFAMENVKNCLTKNGIFIVSPIRNKSKRNLFHDRSWTLQDIKKQFLNYHFNELIPFRNSYLLIIKKP